MTAIWSALVVLLLLAPFGGVGITQTPVEAEIVTSPRGPAASATNLRVERELPPVVTVTPVVSVVPVLVRVTRACTTPLPVPPCDWHPSAGPRDPPV